MSRSSSAGPCCGIRSRSRSRAAGRVALVIGGTGGIGRAIVARLVAQQANVHVLDLARSADWSSSHSSPCFHAVDVGDEPGVDATIDAIAQDEGRLDYLV